MLKRFAPLVPLALVTLLFGCAAHTPVSQQVVEQSAQNTSVSQTSALYQEELATEKELEQFSENSKPYELPALADSILAGIYLGDDQFIHSSSRRSGGVRIDNLGDSYWSKTFMEAKRALAMAPTSVVARK